MQMLQQQPPCLGQLGLENSIGTMHAPSVLVPPVNQPAHKEQPQLEGVPGASSIPQNRLMFNNSVFNTYNYLHPEAASLMAAKGETSSDTSTRKTESISTPKRSNIIYETQLMCKGRGFPLWVPQPNMRLPASQRAKGVSIGDVGIITEYGAFDFLFNICISADDPTNPRDLPEGFTTLALKAWDVREFRDFPNGSYLASPSVGKAVKGDDRRVTTFESSAEESALLSMPEGAYHEEVNDLSKFRDYAEKHVGSWYDFVLHHRGRKDTANGDIRLVVGVDKSTSWGIASFSDPFKLQLKETEDPVKRDCPYTWEHTGRSGEVKAGPDSCDNEDLCSTGGGKVRNQTLFVRTLNILLARDVWDEIQKPREVVDRDDAAEFGVSYLSSDVAMSSSSLTTMTPRLLKRPVSPDEEDEFRPRTKSRRVSADPNFVYLRRMFAKGLPVGESPDTLKGEHIPVYSEAEKKIKYEWMKGSYDCLPRIPPALRHPWKVPVQKANKVAVEPSPPAQPEDEIHPVGETSQRFDYIRSSRGSSAVAHLAPPGYRKMQFQPIIPLKSLPNTSQPPTRPPVVDSRYSSSAHRPSTALTIPASTTEQRALEMLKRIQEGSEQVDSLSYLSTPWSAPGFVQALRKGSAEPSLDAQSDGMDSDSDDVLGIGSRYQYRVPTLPLNISNIFQPRAPTAEEYRRPIAGPLGQPRSRREKFEDLRAKAHEERMKPGSSSHVPQQDATLQTQSISYKGDDVILPPCSSPSPDDGLMGYEAEWSPTEDPGWVQVNLKSQPNKHESHTAKIQSTSSKPSTSTGDSEWPRLPSVQELEAEIEALKRNQASCLEYHGRSTLNSLIHGGPIFASPSNSITINAPRPKSEAEKPHEYLDWQQPRISGRPYLPRAELDTEFELPDSTKIIGFHRSVKSSLAEDVDEPNATAPLLKHLRDTPMGTINSRGGLPPNTLRAASIDVASVDSESSPVSVLSSIGDHADDSEDVWDEAAIAHFDGSRYLKSRPFDSLSEPSHLKGAQVERKKTLALVEMSQFQVDSQDGEDCEVDDKKKLPYDCTSSIALPSPAANDSIPESRNVEQKVVGALPISRDDDDMDYTLRPSSEDFKDHNPPRESVRSETLKSVEDEYSILKQFFMPNLEKPTFPEGTSMPLGMVTQLKEPPFPPVSHNARISGGEDSHPSPDSPSVVTVSRSLERTVDGGSPMNCDTDDGLSTVKAHGVNDGADGSNASRYKTLSETGHEADMDPAPQHSGKSGSLQIDMPARLQRSAKPIRHNSGPDPEELDSLLEHLLHGQRTRRFHRRDRPDMLLIRSEITSERHIDATRLGPRPKVQGDARRDLDNGATSNWGLREGTVLKHPSLAINSWILGAAGLPSSAKMAITHDSAWYGILDDQSLRRAYRVRLAIEHQELEATDSDTMQSLYSICVTPAKTAMYLEPKDKRDNADLLGVARHLVEVTISALRADGRAIFGYLLGSYRLLQSESSSANTGFSHRQLQIFQLKSKLSAEQSPTAPSTTFDSLQLLDYHPARPVTIEVLLQVLNSGMTAKEACDSNSVGELRKALQAARDDKDLTQRILRKLANALLNRAVEFSDKDNVEEAIFYYQYLEPSTPTESMEYLELILGLCTTHYLRYQLLRMREDLDSVIKYLDAQTSLNFVVLLDHFIARCAGMISL